MLIAASVCTVMLLAAQAVAHDSSELQKSALRILRDNCLVCHNEEQADGGYSLGRSESAFGAGDSGLAAIVPGRADLSELVARLTTQDSSVRMPLDSEPLPQTEIEVLQKWIASDPEWALSPKSSLIEVLEESGPTSLGVTDPLLATYSNRLPPLSICFDTDRNRVYVAGWGEIIVRSVSDPEYIERWTGLDRRIPMMSISNDNRWLAVASGVPGKSGAVSLIDLQRTVGNDFDTVQKEQDAAAAVPTALRIWSDVDLPSAIAFAPTESVIAIGSMGGKVSLVDFEAGKMLYDSAAHADQVLALAWSKDGRRWMSGSRDRTARVMLFPSHELEVAYSGHDRAVGSVAISDYGPLTREEAGSIRLWHSSNGNRVLTRRADLPQRIEWFGTQDERVFWLDGNRLASARITKRQEEIPGKEGEKPTQRTIYTMPRSETAGLQSDQPLVSPANNQGWYYLREQDGTGSFQIPFTDQPQVSVGQLYP